MWHHNERERTITVGDREVPSNITPVAGFVGNVFNIGQLIMLKIGFASTDR